MTIILKEEQNRYNPVYQRRINRIVPEEWNSKVRRILPKSIADRHIVRPPFNLSPAHKKTRSRWNNVVILTSTAGINNYIVFR